MEHFEHQIKREEKKRKEKEEAHTNELLANNTVALAQASIKINIINIFILFHATI